jgi:hypothetical protein
LLSVRTRTYKFENDVGRILISEAQENPSDVTEAGSKLNAYMHSNRRIPTVLGLVIVPWLAVGLLTAGVWSAFCMIGYTIFVFAIGYGVVSFVLPVSSRMQGLFLAPALGIVAISAVGALALRFGLPLSWVLVLWFGLLVPGAIALWSDRSLWAKESVAYGGTLVALSVLICLVYFLPSARNDAVLRSDGSFNWMYVDTQHFYAIAAAIESGGSPPQSPGSSTAQLLYHFGPYVPAAAISELTGLDLGDSLARVTRGASLWALTLSSFGIGTLLSIRANGRNFGGVMSVAGLFFYGSLMSLFSNEANSSSYVAGAILYKIPGIEVLGDGGPFSHLVLGHSLLHGLVAITSILGLCLIGSADGSPSTWRALGFVLLPALAVPTNSVAALYIVGAVGILLFWDKLGSPWTWLSILLMLCFFLAAWRIMGFTHSSDAAGAAIKQHILWQWRTIVISFLVGLGFRISALKWISKSFSDPLSVLVLATILGLLSFSLVLHLKDDNERYGIYFLQAMFSIFAFSRLKLDSWRSEERSRWAADWFRLAGYGMFTLASAGALAGIWLYIRHSHAGIPSFGRMVLFVFLVSLGLTVIAAFMKRNHSFAAVCSAILMGALAVGFLAWITPWLDYGLGRMKMDVTLMPGEVQGLRRLRELAPREERFATNRHEIPSLALRRERSYAYGGFSERPVLLEGYLDRGITALPWFDSMLRDNDTLFSTKDPATLHRIAVTYQVHWLVARPGTDIAVSRPLPSWLVEQQNTGDLKIYRVN